MKKSIIILLVGLIATFSQSCNSDEDIPSDALVSLEMKAATTQSQVVSPGGRIAENGYYFTEVKVGVTEIEFETVEEQKEEAENGEEAEDDEIEFEGNFIVDLLAGTSDPDFDFSALLPGIYKEIEIELENIVDGKTIVANFYFITPGTTDTTFVEFSTAEELELEVENEQGIILDEGTMNDVLVTLDLDLLFASIDFSAYTPDENGVIVISDDTNQELMSSILETMEDAFEADEYEDDDDDDDDEEDDD